MTKHPEITIGARVKYSRAFLRSTGMFSGPVPFAKGTVTAIQSYTGDCPDVATVQWDNINSQLQRILVNNLWPCAKGHLEPA